MWCNSNSYAANGNSAYGPTEDGVVRSLPWLFRAGIPGFEGGWPPR